MKFIFLLFIAFGWVFCLVPFMYLTIYYLAEDSTGLALCFGAIVLGISGHFVDILLKGF